MKKMKVINFIFVSLGILALRAPVEAAEGSGTRGGGQGIVLDDQAVRLRDLFGRTSCKWIEPGTLAYKTASYGRAIESIRKVNRFLAKAIDDEVSSLAVCETNSSLVKVDSEDYDSPLIDVLTYDKNIPVQVAVKIGNEVYLNNSNYQRMSDHDRAFLWIHEALHNLIETDAPQRNSRLRDFVSVLNDLDAEQRTMGPSELAFQMDIAHILKNKPYRLSYADHKCGLAAGIHALNEAEADCYKLFRYQYPANIEHLVSLDAAPPEYKNNNDENWLALVKNTEGGLALHSSNSDILSEFSKLTPNVKALQPEIYIKPSEYSHFIYFLTKKLPFNRRKNVDCKDLAEMVGDLRKAFTPKLYPNAIALCRTLAGYLGASVNVSPFLSVEFITPSPGNCITYIPGDMITKVWSSPLCEF